MRAGLLNWVCLAAAAVSGPAMAEVGHSTLEGGVEGIYITGEIEAGDEESFGELAASHPSAIVFLESPGGSLLPAIEIGKLVREHRYPTAVLDQGTCTSSCALIWLAGTPRYLDAGGHLGFHASYTEEGDRLIETGVGNAVTGHYLSQLELSEKAVIFATSASPYNLAWLTEANSGDADIAFDAGAGSLPRPADTFLALSGPLEKAKVSPAAPPAELAAAPGKDTPFSSNEPPPGLEKAGAGGTRSSSSTELSKSGS